MSTFTTELIETEENPVYTGSSSKYHKLKGCVKWYNNKNGYGFVTVLTEGDLTGTDIFVHYKNISISDQYKYLVQGEYVEFVLEHTPNAEHTVQVSYISGIMGGKLMCQTNQECPT